MRELPCPPGLSCPPCPLCGDTPRSFHVEGSATFWHSPACDLVFRDPAQQLPSHAELARYREHRNSVDDPDYLAFLSRLADPLTTRLAGTQGAAGGEGAAGLDFGCGPVPAMEHILSRRGFRVRSWDPYFADDRSALAETYDFVTCSEVLEHIADALPAWRRLESLVADGGVLAVMTQLRQPALDFGTWWYRRDPTHMCFYSESTLRWIGARFGWELELHPRSVALFTIRR